MGHDVVRFVMTLSLLLTIMSRQAARKCLFGHDINWVKTKDLEVRLSKIKKEKKEQNFLRMEGSILVTSRS